MEQFVKNEDGTVTDTKNGLDWSVTLLKDADLTKAEEAVKALGPEWRMPTVDESLTLVDRKRHSPAANTDFFPDMESDWYWTDDKCAWNEERRWVVDFNDGLVSYLRQGSYACVRAVRASQ